jgi:hypothetical protein
VAEVDPPQSEATVTLTRRIGYALVFSIAGTLAACGGAEPAVATSSAAIDAVVCQADLTTLRAETQQIQFLSANAAKDLAGLLAKLDYASTKLSLGKYADAVQKLTDYENQVITLAAQGKLADAVDGTVTVQMLIDGAEAAKACIIPPAI